MAFQKAKALKEAEKSVAQGKITQAIKLYQAILDNDPSDLTILNTVGDLYIRDRNITEGLRQFHRLAEAYIREGFNVKAIAIYRKISKVDPNSIDTLLKLADLYQLQGLGREARDQYLQAAEFFRKRHQSDRVLEVLHKLAQLDPENINFRQRIGAEMERVGKLPEAAAAYLEAAEISLRRDDWAAADPSLKKAAELDPKNTKVSYQLARLAMAHHQPEEAAGIINSTPELLNDVAGKRVLLDSHLALRKTTEAAALAVEVFHANPAEAAPVFNVSWLLAEKGDVDDACKLLATVADSPVAQNHAGPLLESLRRVLSLASAHIPTLELMRSICERTADEATLTEVLEALGHAYEQAGDLEKAESAYAKLVEREPDNEKLVKLLNAVQQKLGREITPLDFSATQVPMVEQEEEAPPSPIEIDAEQETMVREALENSDLFSRYNLAEKAIAELEKVLQLYPDQIEIHRRILEISRKGFPQRGAQAARELARIFRQHGDPDLAAKYEELAAATGSIPDVSSPLTPLGAENTPSPSPPEFPLAAAAADDSHSDTAAAGLGSSDAPWEARGTEAANVEQPPAAAAETLELDLSDDLDAVIGSAGPALQAESDLTATDEFPMPMEIEPPREELALPPHVEMVLPARESVENAAEAPEIESGVMPAGFDDSRIEVEFYLENGFFDEARKSVTALEMMYPGNSFVAGLRRQVEARLGRLTPSEGSGAETALHEPVVDAPLPTEALPEAATPAPAITSSDMLSDLAGDLSSSLDGLAPRPSTESGAPTEAAGGSTPGPTSGFSQLSGLLSEMEEGGPAASEDDPETHYNLGVAFREMGLLDESIGEFQKVVRGAGRGHYPPNYLQACSLLAICFMEKKMPALAVRWYKRALETPNLDEEALMALQYDMGVAYELSADFRSALERFTEVYSQNIDFRDVAEKIRELQQKV